MAASPLRNLGPAAPDPLTSLQPQALDTGYQPDQGQFLAGLGSAVASNSAGSLASDATKAQIAGDPNAANLVAQAQAAMADAQKGAPRVRSLRDIGSAGDLKDYLAGQLGEQAPGIASGIGGALIGKYIGGGSGGLVGSELGGKIGSAVGATAVGYDQMANAALAEQLSDPKLANLPAEQRLQAAREQAGISAVAGAVVPTAVANPGILSRLGVSARGVIAADIAGQGAAGAVGEYAHQRALDQLTPGRDTSGDNAAYADAVASGAIGGGLAAAPHLVGHTAVGGADAIGASLGAAGGAARNGLSAAADAVRSKLPGGAAEPAGTGAGLAGDDVLPESTLAKAGRAATAIGDRVGPNLADLAGNIADGAKGKIEDLAPTAEAAKDAVISAAGKAKTGLDSTLDKMAVAAKDAPDMKSFLRQSFGSDDDINDLMKQASGTDSDLAGSSLPETQANLANAPTLRAEKTTGLLQGLMDSDATSQAIKDQVAKLDPAKRDDQIAAAKLALSQRVSALSDDISTGLKSLWSGVKSGIADAKPGSDDEGATPKFNRQRTDPAEQHAMSSLVFEHLRPELQNDPQVQSKLDTVAQQLFRFSMVDGKELTSSQLPALTGLQDIAQNMFVDPARALKAIADKGAQLSDHAKATGGNSILSRAADPGSAVADSAKPNSFLYASLDPQVKDTLTSKQLPRLAQAVDQATLGQGKASDFARVFGSEERAQQVLDYYRRANQDKYKVGDLGENTPATKIGTEDTQGAKTTLTESYAPVSTEYHVADAKADRPFLDVSDRTVNGKTSNGTAKRVFDAQEHARNIQSQLGPGGKASVVPYHEVLAARGESPERAVARIKGDLETRIEQSKKALAGASAPSDKALSAEQLNRVLGEHALLAKAATPEEALRPYKAVKVEGPEVTHATDEDLKKYAGLSNNTNARATGLTFEKTDGSKIKLSAESMWKSEGDIQGSGEGESTRNRQRRLFGDALDKVLRRPDIKGFADSSKAADVLLDRKTGLKLGGTELQKLNEKLSKSADKQAILRSPEAASELAKLRSADSQNVLSLKSKLNDAFGRYKEAEAGEEGGTRENIRSAINDRMAKIQGDKDLADSPAGKSRLSAYAETLKRMDSQDQIDAPEREVTGMVEPDAEKLSARTPEGGYPETIKPKPEMSVAQAKGRLNKLAKQDTLSKDDLKEGQSLKKFVRENGVAYSDPKAGAAVTKIEATESHDPTAVARAETKTGQDVLASQRQMGEPETYRAPDLAKDTAERAAKIANPDTPTIVDAYSRMKNAPGRPKLTDEARQKIIDQVTKMRGPDVEVAFRKAMDLDGASGSYEYNPENGKRLISIALNAKNPMSVAYHESLHDFFGMLAAPGLGQETRGARKFLLQAAESGPLKAQLRGLLAEHPEALRQVEQSPEERLAYAYQFWSEGKLKIGPTTETWFHKVADFVRQLFGAVSQDEKLSDVFQQLNDGKLAEPNTVAAVLADRGLETIGEKTTRLFGPVKELAEKLNGSVADRFRSLGSPAATELADLFYKDPSRESGKLGFIQSRGKMQAQFSNRLQDVVGKATKTEMREALENFQAMKAPSSPLERGIAGVLKDIRKQMIDSGVARYNPETNKYDTPIGNVKNYFPRNWDPNTVRSQQASFKLLMEKHGVSSGDADNIIKSILSSSDGQIDMADNENHAGYTPFTKALEERKLNFINETNAKDFAPFQGKDLFSTLNTYIYQAAHRSAFAETFGNGGERIEQLKKQAGLEGITAKEQADVIDKGVQAMSGTLGYGFSPRAKEVMSGVMSFQNLVLLPMALFSSLIDPLGISVRTGKFADAGKAFMYGMKGLARDIGRQGEDEHEKLARTIGLITDESMTDSMGQVYTSSTASAYFKKMNSTFFKLNGMETWNRRMRVSSMVAGMRFLADNVNHDRYMTEMGIEKGDVMEKPDGHIATTVSELKELNPKLSTAKAQAIEGRVQSALYRFVDSTVLRPNAAQRPIWGSDPKFQLIFHMKQFTHSFQNTLLKRVGHEMDHGNMQPALVLASYVPFMFAADIARGALTGKVSNWSDVMRVAGSSISRSGIMGTGQFGDDAWNDVKHGGLPGQTFLGPTFDHAMNLVKTAAGREDPHDLLMRSIPLGSLLKAPITPTLSSD